MQNFIFYFTFLRYFTLVYAILVYVILFYVILFYFILMALVLFVVHDENTALTHFNLNHA